MAILETNHSPHIEISVTVASVSAHSNVSSYMIDGQCNSLNK